MAELYGDAGRTGLYEATGLPMRAAVAWRARTDAPVVASPVLASDLLLAVDAGGTVYAWDTVTGEPRWRRDLDVDEEWYGDDPASTTAPAVEGDRVFVEGGEDEGSVYVLDLRTGELQKELEDGGCPTVIGDVLLLIEAADDGVRALGLPDLEPRWHGNGVTFSGWLRTSPALSGEGVAYAALGFEGQRTHSGLCAVDLYTGEEIFFRGDDNTDCPLPAADDDDELGTEEDGEVAEEVEKPGDWLLFHPTHPVVADGRVWAVHRRVHEDDGVHLHPMPWESVEVVGLDPNTGETTWRYPLDPARWSLAGGAVAVAGGVVYFVANQGGQVDGNEEEPGKLDVVLHAIDIATAQPRWTRPLPGTAAGSPVLAGGALYVATVGGTVLAFDVVSGEPRWTLDVGAMIADRYDLLAEDYGDQYDEAGLAVLPADDMIYVRTREGIVALC